MSTMFGLGHLIETEDNTILSTKNRLKGVAEYYPRIIELLFKLPYVTGKIDGAEMEIGALKSFCFTHYTQAPYTFWTIYNLYEKGYYLEVLILYRHLLEAFVQMRFFNKYPDKLMNHITGTKRTKFKTMFDEFAKESYKRFYGEFLSGATHGMVIKDVMRFQRNSATEGRTVMGCEYNEDHATLVLNLLVPLFLGFLTQFECFFPENIVSTDTKIREEIKICGAWLEKNIEGHKKVNPRSVNWYRQIDGLFF